MTHKREDWCGMSFTVNDIAVLEVFLPQKHAQKATVFLSKNKTGKQWRHKDWQVSRLDNGEIFVLYTPARGISVETGQELVNRYGQHKGVTGYLPWPWLDNPISVAAFRILLKRNEES